MADFDLSAVMRFDGRQASSEAKAVASSIDGIAAAQDRAAKSSRDLGQASATAERGMVEEGQGARTAATAVDQLEAAHERLTRELNEARVALAGNSAQLDIARTRQRAATKDINDAATANARHANGMRNLGQQFGDFATQVSLGGSAVYAFSAQAGQMGFALSEMGGKAGAVGRFLTGPWGIALTVASLALAPLVEKLFEGGDASDKIADRLEKAAQAADSFGNAQSLLGKIVDLTTGKLKTQNQVLIQTIKLQAQANLLAAQKAQKDATEGLKGVASPTVTERTVANLKDVFAQLGNLGSDRGSGAKNALQAQLAPLRETLDLYSRVANDPRSKPADIDRALTSTLNKVDALGKAGKLAGRDLIEAKEAVLKLGTALNDQRANQDVLDVIAGGAVPDELKPYSRGRKPRVKKPKKAPDTDGFVARVREDIASITADFSDAPTFIEKARAAVGKLDRDIAELQKKKPPNFQSLIDSAREAKAVVEANIAKPFDDFIQDQEDALAVQRLITAGRLDEAAALRIVQQLQRQMGPLTIEQKDAVLATVEAMRMEQREADILREKSQKYLDALASIKSAFSGIVSGNIDDLKNLPKRLLDGFKTLQGQLVFEKLFGSVFRDLQDQINGTNVVKDASDRMADAVDAASSSIGKLGDAAAKAAGAVGGANPAIPGTGGGAQGTADPFSAASLAATAAKALGLPAPIAGAVSQGADIVVNGRRGGSGLPKDATGFYSKALGSITESVARIFTSDEGAKKIGGAIGGVAGKALGGAATGALTNQFLAPLGKALGIKTSSTGAQIGGAIGSFIPIPGGDIIGSVIGSVVGGLFKKTKYGTTTVANGEIVGTKGNSKGAKGRSVEAGNSIISGLDNVAEMLGAKADGDYRVSIGQYDGKWRVSTTGYTGKLNFKGNTGATGKGLKNFGKDGAEEALAYAIGDAIGDGALTGISDAMQRALKANSEDLDRGIKEALKVKDLEIAIGGVGAAIKSVFTDFDREAEDRVRIAKAYGLDVLAVTKLNEEARAQMIEDVVKERIGGLSDFLQSVKFGDLFEGSAAERRIALLGEIDKALADANAGKDGAADTLQSLFSNLVTTSRDAYGTAGPEYVNDRAQAISEVQRVIQMETARVQEAAAAATKAAADQQAQLAQQTALANEANGLAAVANTKLDQILAALQQFGFSGAWGANLALTAR